MSEIYFTIAGTNHWHGQEFIEPGMEVILKKEPDNEVDSEAIKVEQHPHIEEKGYVLYYTSQWSFQFKVCSGLGADGKREWYLIPGDPFTI